MDQTPQARVRAAWAELKQAPLPRGGAHVALIPPAKPGSVGDAAMISGAVTYLRKSGAEAVGLLYGDEWPLDVAIDDRIASSDYFYGGDWRQLTALLRHLRGYTHLQFIGADVIDGAYNPASVNRRLFLLNAFAGAGRHARILGSSYNEAPEHTTAKALAQLLPNVGICARDPVSLARLGRTIGREPKLVADLAFLIQALPERTEAAEALRWITQRREAGDDVIALNANYLHAAKEPRLRDALRAFLESVLQHPVSVILVPHDSRTAVSDRVLLGDAAAGVAEGDRSRVHAFQSESPGAVKAVLEKVSLLLTGRLHAQILALSSGTPAIGLDYQGKFEGVLQHFQLPVADFLCTPAAFAKDPAVMVAAVQRQLATPANLRTRILERLPHVIALAEKNFEP